MLPIKLTAADPEEERARWKIVRCDTLADVPGFIVSASVDTGLCLLRQSNGTSQEHDFRPGGLRIVSASR